MLAAKRFARETLLLCEVEHISYQEIAEILSIPIGTVMKCRSVKGEKIQCTSTVSVRTVAVVSLLHFPGGRA